MKPSEIVDRLAEAYVRSSPAAPGQRRAAALDAAVKVWSFMRPAVPSPLTPAQHHAAAKLVSSAEATLRDGPENDPAKRDLADALELVSDKLSRSAAPSSRRTRRAGRKHSSAPRPFGSNAAETPMR